MLIWVVLWFGKTIHDHDSGAQCFPIQSDSETVGDSVIQNLVGNTIVCAFSMQLI